MDFINQLLPENILYALGWTVVHSLWQAFAVALLLAAYLLGWQKSDARKRYLAGNVALASTLLMAAVTFVFYFGKSQAPELVGELAGADRAVFGQPFTGNRPSFFGEYFNENMPLIVTVWMAGLVFFMLKMLGGLLYIQRLRQRYTSPMPRQWQEMLGSLAGELGLGRTIRLAESALVRVPMVVGWLKPVILLPLGAVNNLAPAQVEAILAHELAHIARHDYLLNLMQSVVEILFYFNPAVWWISSNIRTERENCCDDLAVRLCGNNSLAYAKALVSLQEMHQVAPAFAMSFSKNRNQLLTRIQRILQPSNNKSNVMEKLSATFLLTVAVVLLSLQANTPFGNLLDRLVLKEAPEEAAIAPADDVFFQVQNDTVPTGTRQTHIHRKTDNEDIEIQMKNDEIILLKINGEDIPPERYGEYSELTQELMEDMPEPPEPPMPPMPEMAPMAPMPPSPGSKTRKIITQKDGNGTTFIIENEDGGEPVEIKVKNGKKGTIIVNGQEITGMKKGDKTVILQEVEGAPGAFYWSGEAFEMPEPAEGFHFTPDAFHFEFQEPATTWQLDVERFRANSEMLRELQSSMREGTATQEWLEEHQRALGEGAPAPHLLELEELRGHLDEERARMEPHRHKAMEEQMIQLEKLHEQQGVRHRQVEEQIQKEMEKQQRKIEKELQKKRRSSM